MATFLATYTGTERIRRMYYVDQLIHFMWENPSWSGDELRSAANEQLVKYDTVVKDGQLDPSTAALETSSRWILAAIKGMDVGPSKWLIDPAVELAREVFGINDGLAAEKRTNAQRNLSDMIDRFGEGAAGQIATAYNACRESEACLDALTKGLPEVRLGEDKPPSQMKDDLTSARVVSNNQSIFKQYVTVNSDGSISIAIQSLHDDLIARLSKIHVDMRAANQGIVATLLEIDKDQRNILAWINDQEKQRAAQAKVKEQQDYYNGILDAAKADLGAIVAIANLVDKRLGRGIQVLGSAAITIAEGLMKYASQAASLTKVAGAIGTVIATAALAGTIIGAVVSVIAFIITIDQTDPSQVILTQLGQLQQQVGRLGEQMNARFDRIDRVLAAMYKGMNAAFNELIIQGNQIQGDLTAIQNQLLAQAAQLQRIESAIGNYAVVVSRRDLLSAIAKAVGWNDRSDVRMGLQDFLGYTDIFRSWGTVIALDDAETGSLGRSFAPGNVASELESVSLDRNVSYLDALTRGAGVGAFLSNNGSCPNPLTWSLAARAAAQLMVEQPRLAVRLTSPRTAQLRDVGEQVLKCQQSVCLNSGGFPRLDFFEALVDFYVKSLADCGLGMDAAVDSTLVADRILRGHGSGTASPNPWDGADQVFAYRPASMALIKGSSPLHAPDGILERLPSAAVLASWFEGPDDESVRMAYRADWVKREPVDPDDSLSVVAAKPDISGGPGNVEKWFPHVLIDVYWRDVSIASWSTMLGSAIATNGGPPPPNTVAVTPDQMVHQEWTSKDVNLSAQFLAGVMVKPDATEYLIKRKSEVGQELETLRGKVHVAAENALGSYIEIVEGARLLVGNVVAFGMPHALASDDALRALLEALPEESSSNPADATNPTYGNGLPGRAVLDRWWGDGHQDTSTSLPHYKLQVEALATDKVVLLRDRLEQHLNDVAARKADTLPIVEDALARLELADLVSDGAMQIGELMPTTLPILSIGDTGASVERLQGLLLASIPNLTPGDLAIDGEFGPITQKYVEAFQSAGNLANSQGPSGIVDGLTWRALLGLV